MRKTIQMQPVIKTILFIFLFFSSFISLAQEKESKESKESTEPPQEMFDACKDKKVGDHCSFTNQFNRTISGICTKDSRIILCFPEEPKKKEH